MGNWFIYNKKADFGEIAKKYNITPMTARILRNRDLCTDEDISEYIYGDLTFLHDPFLMKGITEACPFILKAIENNEKIRIMGDYDIDGVCSSYILKTYLSSIGAFVDIDIPDRVTDGYGLSLNMVQKAICDEIKLIITCDNGISAFESIDFARKNGIDVIITDHHEIPMELPNANIIIDPHMEDDSYPFKDLCGAGVAFKLVFAMAVKKQGLKTDGNQFSLKLFDELIMLAGFATVGDIVPLVGENRILVKEGLKRLRNCGNLGLNALIEARGLPKESIETYHIGFILGPCINSAGRLKNAKIALDLLETDDCETANKIAAELSTLNDQRKEMTDKQVDIALDMVKSSEDKVIVINLTNAHESIIGIVAGRIKEELSRPAIVVCETESGIKGSGRSVESYNIIEEITRHSELFDKFGGHAKACGFTLKDGITADTLREKLNESCKLSLEQLTEKKWIDMQLPFEYASIELAEELNILAPFGVGNLKPVFAEKNITVIKSQIFGKDNNVLKLSLKNDNGTVMDGVIFGNQEKILRISNDIFAANEKNGHVKVMFIYSPKINEFRGKRSIQAVIDEIIVQ